MTNIYDSIKYVIVTGIALIVYSCNHSVKQAEIRQSEAKKESIELDKDYSYKDFEIIAYKQYTPQDSLPFHAGDKFTALFIVDEAYGTLINTQILSLKEDIDEITGEKIINPIFEGNEGNNYVYTYLFKGLNNNSRSAIDCFQFDGSDEWNNNQEITIDFNNRQYHLGLKDASNERKQMQSTLILSQEDKSQELINLPFKAKNDDIIFPKLFTDLDGDGKPDLIMYYYTEDTSSLIEHTLLFLSSESDNDSFLKLVAIQTNKVTRTLP